MSESSGMMHQWMHVVIPATSEMLPLYVGHCRNCKAFYSEWVPMPDLYSKQGEFTKSNIPVWGCVEPPLPLP